VADSRSPYFVIQTRTKNTGVSPGRSGNRALWLESALLFLFRLVMSSGPFADEYRLESGMDVAVPMPD
jgi:hypothetical protein